MARQISIDAAEAFIQGYNFKRSNTEVAVQNGTTLKMTSLYLFDNCIARIENGKMKICDGGHQTVTTKERLNSLPGVRIYQKNHQWYLNDLPWDGTWIEPSKIILKTFNITEEVA